MTDRFNYSPNLSSLSCKNTGGLRGAMVARLTPDQKDVCSNHVVFESRRGNYISFKIYI